MAGSSLLRPSVRFVGFLFLSIFLYVVIVLVAGALTDWQPEAVTAPLESGQADRTVVSDSVVSLAIWNLGYGGLGAESDFFYDDGGFFFANGKMVRSPEEAVDKNIAGQTAFAKNTPVDFYLLQEVDYESKRSYFNNQFENFAAQLPGYHASFAANYKNKRVPLPIAEPWRAYGSVNSGLATYSEVQPTESVRYQLPGEFEFPTRLFQLDRCALLTRYPTAFGGDLVLVNLHNSAYDSDGSMKRQQMKFLQKLALDEYEAGNYVILGGDWNQVPPFFPFDKFMPGKAEGYSQIPIEADYLPENWRYGYDPNTPTNRKTKEPYQQFKTFETLIDFFVVSPNLRIRKVEGVPQGFAYSDHQPVTMEVEFVR